MKQDRGRSKELASGFVELEMPCRRASGNVKGAVGYLSLELQGLVSVEMVVKTTEITKGGGEVEEGRGGGLAEELGRSGKEQR